MPFSHLIFCETLNASSLNVIDESSSVFTILKPTAFNAFTRLVSSGIVFNTLNNESISEVEGLVFAMAILPNRQNEIIVEKKILLMFGFTDYAILLKQKVLPQ